MNPFLVFHKTAADAVLISHEISEISESSQGQRLAKYPAYQALIVWPTFCIYHKRKAERMTLRIDISDERDRVVFTLTGRIQAEQLSELQSLVKSDLPDHSLVLDLKDVKLVDRDAVRFLAEIEAQGVKLRNCSAFVREWISRERHGMQVGKTINKQV